MNFDSIITITKNRLAWYSAKILGLWIVYTPLIMGISGVMMFFYGLFIPGIFFIFFPLSWILADPSILWIDLHRSWINTYLKYINYDHLLVIEIIVFVTGLMLFLVSFTELIRGMAKQQDIIQVGIYKYIRHPQNLAIIIMAFPFALYVPGFGDAGIRLADLITWVQFAFLVVIYSDLEDRRMKKKYPETFTCFYESTGFMFPKLLSLELFSRFSFFHGVKKRYMLLVLLYIISVGIVQWMYLNLPIIGYM